jgi:hypothetical protein
LTFFTPQFLSSSAIPEVPVMMPGFLTRSNRSNLQTICSQTPPPHEPDDFWHRCSSVCSRIGQRHRLQQVDITRIGREERATSLRCPERPAHQVSPPLSTRRLAGVRYQLDSGACSSWDRRQWSTPGGSRRPLVRQVPTHRCHLSKRDNPACAQISDAWHSIVSHSSSSSAAAAVGV